MTAPISRPLAAFLLMTCTLSALVPLSQGYYYYYYYYYYTYPNTCPSLTNYRNMVACHINSCLCAQSWSNCCVGAFLGYNGVPYQQCVCPLATSCGTIPATPQNNTVATTASTTSTTQSTSTTTTTRPTTTTTTTRPTTTTTTTTTTRTTARPTNATTASTTARPTNATTVRLTNATTASTTARPTNATTARPTNATTASTTRSTTTTSTTTSTTTTPTTTPPFRSLCDTSGFRILGGESANDCDFNGVANVTMMDGQLAVCDLTYTTATVNGVLKNTFVTTKDCYDLLKAGTDIPFEIQIGSQKYPLGPPLFNLYTGDNGKAYVDINSRYSNLVSNLGCQKPACAYNPTTMAGKVDFSDCNSTSYGVSDAESFEQSGLKVVKVAAKPGGCSSLDQPPDATNTICFETKNKKNFVCSGDSGAPVYCLAPSNKEKILVGYTGYQAECDQTPEFRVIPA